VDYAFAWLWWYVVLQGYARATFGEAPMPNKIKSKAQNRLMQAAAHTPGGVAGVPQSVGRKMTEGMKKGALRGKPNRVKKGKS